MEIKFNEFLITDDKSKLQIDIITQMLNNSYWAENRTKEVIEKSIDNSICIGVYDKDKQIGFARCVTDYATVYWVCDVIIENDYRGQGLGKSLMEAIIEHKDLISLMGILGTKDAHGLYEQYGFFHDKDRFMRRFPK